MSRVLTIFWAVPWLALCIQSSGHGWTAEMIAKLNAPAPEWLTIVEPIRVELIEDQFQLPSIPFRDKSGGVTVTGTKVVVAGRGIEINVLYPITWWSNGASLSPDGSKLVINSGSDAHLIEILPDGAHREIECPLPLVTYDAGPKGFISGWTWVEDDVLLGSAEIDNERGEFIEQRLYGFHLQRKTLSRLDLSGLNLPSLEGLSLIQLSTDLKYLRMAIGDKAFVVKADLSRLDVPVTSVSNSDHVQSIQNRTPLPQVQSKTVVEDNISLIGTSIWPWIAAAIALVLVVMVTRLKKRVLTSHKNSKK